jgi:hypothetical protein
MAILYTIEDTPCYPNRYKVVPVGNYKQDNAARNYFPTEEQALIECIRREEFKHK